MKIIVASFLLMFSLNAFAQPSPKFYFDKGMHQVPEKDAQIYGTGEMDSGHYKLTCYYLKRKNPLACVAHFMDSTQMRHEGLFQYYYENGGIETKGNYQDGEKEGLWVDYDQKGGFYDSTEYKNGRALMRTGFYDLPGNNQKLVIVDDIVNSKFYSTLFDSKGNVLSKEEMPEDYTDMFITPDTSCSFPGGPALWQQYITRALLRNVPDYTDDDYGTVLIRFVVDGDGNITEVRPLNKKTSRLAKIGFNTIAGGPKWIPAEHNGKKVKTIIIQPLFIQNPFK